MNHTRSIVIDLVLTVVTLGLWNIWVQYKQMQAMNMILKEERYKFWHWALFTLITFGFYHFYHEYKKTLDLKKFSPEMGETEPILIIVIIALGLTPVADAVQQHHINKYFEKPRIGTQDLRDRIG